MTHSTRWFRLAGLALVLALLLPQTTLAAGRSRVYPTPHVSEAQLAAPAKPAATGIKTVETSTPTATAPITATGGSGITHALGAIHDAAPDVNATVQEVLVDLPAALDWRNYNGGNYISPVQDQGNCGSCWAFAGVAALESLQSIASATPGTFRDLSEQIVASCDLDNFGCIGGYMSSVARFLRTSGTSDESCYPYRAIDSNSGAICGAACADYPANAAKTYTYISVPKTLAALKSALQYGPLAVTFNVYPDFYYDYAGVYQYDGAGYFMGGHAVLLVGYQDLPRQYGGGYFICKNSWGADWGENGYFRIGYDQLGSPINFGGDAYRYALTAVVPNDDFDQATVIATAPYTTTQDTTGAANAADDPSFTCVNIGQGSNSVWFQYRPSYSGLMTVTTSGSTYDTVLGVWTGSRGALVSRGCSDDINYPTDLTSQVAVSVTANITYYIEVAGYSGASYGTLNLNLTRNNPYYLYGPITYNSFCSPLPYNETVLYNMAKVRATQAWPCPEGGAGVIIAILDTGADSNHPDLAANLVAGTSFVTYTTSWEDDHGHGTHVSGIAAGVANNGGIFGVAPRAKIMPVKVCNQGGVCPDDEIAMGIVWAVDHGAQVINMSLGGDSDSTILHDAVRYAYEHGVAIICSAGNSGDSTVIYPASYDEVIAVAATDSNDNWALFSTYGPWVDVSAPGVNILSSYPWNTYLGLYEYLSGTSMASPHVAGEAALIRKLRPDWTVDQVYAQIRASVDDVGDPGFDYKTGYGRINALKAVDALSLAVADALPVPAQVQSVATPVSSDPSEFSPGVVLFALRPGTSLAAIMNQATINAASLQAEVAVAQLGVLRLNVPAGEELSYLKLLRSLPEVEYAELDGIMHIQ